MFHDLRNIKGKEWQKIRSPDRCSAAENVENRGERESETSL